MFTFVKLIRMSEGCMRWRSQDENMKSLKKKGESTNIFDIDRYLYVVWFLEFYWCSTITCWKVSLNLLGSINNYSNLFTYYIIYNYSV